MSEVSPKTQENEPKTWSILGEAYDPIKTPPDPLRLQQIERSVIDFSPDTAARSWATQLVIHALELCSPKLLEDEELLALALGDIAQDSHAFRDRSEERLNTLAKELSFSDDTPIMRALSAIYESDRETRGEKRSYDINKLSTEIPNLSKRLVQYMFIKQQGLTDSVPDGDE